MESSRDPSNFQDWSVWRNFHEAARLMTTHFRVFLPTLLYVLFPMSLIRVANCLFLVRSYSQANRRVQLLNWILVGMVGSFLARLLFHASDMVLDEMKTTVYVLDADMYGNGESHQVQPDQDGYGRRRFRVDLVSVVCYLVYILYMMVPVVFGFAGVADMGMPDWTTALFTPFLVAGMSLLSLYYVLVVTLVVRLWMYARQSASASMV